MDDELLHKGSYKEPELLKNYPGTRPRRAGRTVQSDVSGFVRLARISRSSVSPFARANNPAKQLVSPVVEVVHLLIQAMLITLAILQIVVRLLSESHYAPVKNRRE